MRINVFISSTGYCSRREADRLISSGEVLLNGAKALLGTNIGENDIVTIDGKRIEKKPETVYLAFNKPRGVESTTEHSNPDNIIDFIGYPERVFPIGRLDKNSSGLILLTNDGTIVNKILRSEFEHEKEYLVDVDKPVTESFIKAMSAGVRIFNPVRQSWIKTKPCQVKMLSPHSFSIVLTQGINLQIRRMTHELGYRVLKLKRIRIMHIKLQGLLSGKWRTLTESEVNKLKEAIDKKGSSNE
ncbi:MAG: pseudouridine synthase [Candidatus Omnitrophica bacterium]|nr:pseudouridine synthase [Candidatus Omnitrophota bacterium]